MAYRRSVVTPADGREHLGVLWLVRWVDIPFNYVLDRLRQYESITTLEWQKHHPREWEWIRSRGSWRNRRPRQTMSYGRELRIRRPTSEREYPLTVTLVSPRLLWRLVKAPQHIIVSIELNAATLFAVVSKIRRHRKVVVLFEGDVSYLGATGTAKIKVLLRRLMAKPVDVFVSNSSTATTYLTDVIGVKPERIVEEWWLAGLPDGDVSAGADDTRTAPPESPVFLTAGHLIPRKGIDLLLTAVARYREECGPCRLRIVGDGPERQRLEHQATELGIANFTEFVGAVPHQRMAKELRACDLFVFPTLYDLVGRVAVEALSVGTPVAVSHQSGAAGTLIREGENGVIMNPRDPDSLLDALRRAMDPATYNRIVRGARVSAAALTPETAARIISGAIARARDN